MGALAVGVWEIGFLRGGGDSPTLPETNITPENGWLEYYFPIGFRPIFKGYVSFWECNVPQGSPIFPRNP